MKIEIPDFFYSYYFWMAVGMIIFMIIFFVFIAPTIVDITEEDMCKWCVENCRNKT